MLPTQCDTAFLEEASDFRDTVHTCGKQRRGHKQRCQVRGPLLGAFGKLVSSLPGLSHASLLDDPTPALAVAVQPRAVD